MSLNLTELKDFCLSKVDTSDKKSCWLWTGAKDSSGYGKICKRVDGKNIILSTHRDVWIGMFGLISIELEIMHICDTPECINYHHMVLGTHNDNILDMYKKGRNGNTKFDLSLIDQLIKEYSSGSYTQKELALKYNISRTHVCVLVNKKFARKY